MIWRALAGAAAVSFMSAFLCVGAQADTLTAILQDPSIGYSAIESNGLTFQITSCSFTAQGTGSAVACNPGAANNLPAGDEIQAVIINGGASFQFVNANGDPVMSVVSNGGTKPFSHNLDDLTVTFNITPTNSGSKTTISSVSASVSGTATQSTELSGITAGLTVTAGSSNYPLNAAADGTTGAINFPGTNSLSVNYDLKVNATGTPGGDILTLVTVPTSYSPAPEPASLLLLGPATLMLGRLRKRRRTGRSA